MKKHLYTLLLLTVSAHMSAQTTVPLTDNLDLQSNTVYQIQPGQYTVPDAGLDGLIRIDGQQNVTVDGAGVQAVGDDFTGYLIRIHNSENVTLRNFTSARSFFYAVYVTDSKNITIENSNFSWNKVDSTGWISIWTDTNQALGGGALLANVDGALIRHDTMKFQNDGVALYHCKNVELHDNDLSWNTSFGIRMYFTDSSYVHHNNCSHVNRPYTDPSDCAALLMLVSNNNRVEHNDLSYSGDGVFLGQYQYSNIPNNNYFAYNECSFSPHNAIEATFADGNVYKHNKCNNSHYGLWLGYSFNSVVDSNEVLDNQYAGIAIDRGFNNVISHNDIRDNPTGIELWRGDPITGYAGQQSHGYGIFANHFEGNATAISLVNTYDSDVRYNTFDYNRRGIFTDGNVVKDSLTSNYFTGTTTFHVEHRGASDLFAQENIFTGADSALVERKIYDELDDPAAGRVDWQNENYVTFPSYQPNPVHDLAEPPARWYAYPEANWGYGLEEPTTVTWDSTLKKVGAASVHLRSGNGWDLGLSYHPGGDSTAQWSLTDLDTLHVWFRTVRQIPYGFQFFHIRLGDDHGGYYEYTAPVSVLNNAHLSWKSYKFPLAGNTTWQRTAHGNVTLDSLNYVEIHADTWDFGFDLWVDGLRFGYAGTPTQLPARAEWAATVFPNPANGAAWLRLTLPENDALQLDVYDWSGRRVRHQDLGRRSAGTHTLQLDCQGIAPGSYVIQVRGQRGTVSRRVVLWGQD